jgi:hypothetical protein
MPNPFEQPAVLSTQEKIEEPLVTPAPSEATASPVITAEEEDDLLTQPACYQKGGCNKPRRAAGFCMGVGEG